MKTALSLSGNERLEWLRKLKAQYGRDHLELVVIGLEMTGEWERERDNAQGGTRR